MSGPVNPQTLSPAFQQTRHARRIYVGGIPPNYADEEALKYFLNSVIAKGMGVENDNSYILSMYINQKKCFAFVELRAIELATACLDLDGIIYKKVILKVLRANEYKPELIPPSLLGKPIVFDLTSFAFGSPLANNLGMMPQGMGSYSTEEYSYGQQGQYQQQPQQIDFKQDTFSPKAGEQGRQEKNKELQPELKFDSIIHSLPIGQIIPNSLVLIGLPNISSPAEETEKLKRTPPPFGSIAGTPNNASSRDLTARSLSVETAGQGCLNHGLKITTSLSASKVLRNVLRKTKFGSLSNPEFDTTLTEARISDIGDVPQGATPDDLKQNLSNMVSEALIHGGTPFVVGGSCEDVTHSSALGLLNVVSSEQPVSLVTVSAQLGDNRILTDTRFQEFKASVFSVAAADTTTNIIIDNNSNNNNSNTSNSDTSPLNGMHNPDQQICHETEDNNNSNNINNNNNIDGIAAGACQTSSALPSKYVRFAAQGSQCTIETANFVTEKGGKIVWLTKDIRCGREIADWPAVPEEISKKFLSHACKLFEQALIYAAGNRENSNDNSSVNIDSGEAISPLTPANRNTTTTTSTTIAENTTTENGSTIVSVPAVHSQSNDSIAEEFRSQLGPQEGANDEQQNTINNNTNSNTNNSNNNSNTITMFPIVVTIDMNVLQQIDKNNNNSNSSTNSSVLGLTLDEVLDMARIAGANEHVAVFAVTDYTPDTDDTNSKGNLVLAEILYRFNLGVASRNSGSGNNSINYTMGNVVMEHSASHGSLGYESSNSNSSLDLLAAAAVHHHNNSSGNNSTSNSNSSSNYNLKKLFHYAYQPNTITSNYNSLHNISMDSVYNTVNYAQQSTPTNANRMNNNSEHENMFSNNNNNSNNKHIVHMSAGGTGNNNNNGSSYNMNSDYYQSHLSQQQQQQQQQFNNKHQPINPSRQSQNTHNMLSRQLSMGQMSMTNPAAPPTQQQQQNYGSTISPTHYQQQLSLQQQNQQNQQNSQRFETSTVTTNAININAYAKPFTPPPDITQLNLPQPGSGERNRGSSYGNSSNNSSNYNLNIGSHSHSSHGSALNSHVNSHNSSHSNLHASLNNSNNINNSSISNLNNALLHQQIPTLNHNNALHGRSMSDNTMGSLVHHSNITLRHQNSNFNIHQNNHSSSQYAILQQLQTQAQQQADSLQHNSYNNNGNNNNSHNNNNNNSQHNRTLSPMSPLHGSMGRSVHNIVPSQQPISPPPQKSFHQQSSLPHAMQHNTQQNSNNNSSTGNNGQNSQQTPSISPVNSSRSLLSVQSFPLTMPQSSFSLSQQQQVQMLSQRDNSTSNLRSLGSTISLQNTPRDHNLMRQHSDHPGGSMFTFTDDNTRLPQQPPQNYNSSNSNKNGNNNNTNSTYIDYNMNNHNSHNINNNKQQHGEVNYAGLSSLNLRDRDNKVNAGNNQHNQQHKHNALYRTNSNLSTISMSEIHEFDESLDLFGDLPPPPTAGRSRGQSIGQLVQHQQQHQQQHAHQQNTQNQHNTNQHNTNNSNNQSGYNNNNNNSYISGSSPAASSVASSVANGDMVWSLN